MLTFNIFHLLRYHKRKNGGKNKHFRKNETYFIKDSMCASTLNFMHISPNLPVVDNNLPCDFNLDSRLFVLGEYSR